jgi:hypothetical protein
MCPFPLCLLVNTTGEVHRCKEIKSGREFAVKVLLPAHFCPSFPLSLSLSLSRGVVLRQDSHVQHLLCSKIASKFQHAQLLSIEMDMLRKVRFLMQGLFSSFLSS